MRSINKFSMACVGVAMLGGCAVAQPGTPVAISIDAKIRHQTMEGFGATTLSLVNGSFDYQSYDNEDNLSPELRAQASKVLYGEVGLTMGNLNLPIVEQRGNDDDDPLHLNLDGFDWREVRFVKQKIVDAGKPYGFDNYSLSPSIDFRRMSWLKPIREADYNRYLDECAEHVLAVAQYWRDNYGSLPRTLMLFNEPLSGNGELQGGSKREVVDIVKRSGARLQQAGLKIKFIVPNEETETKSLETATAILADPQARQYVAAIGYHPYPYGSPYASVPKILKSSGAGKPDASRIKMRRKLKELGARYGIPLWMTEVSHGEVPFDSLDELRGRAIHIHDELKYADAAAYFGMNALWDTKTHREHTNGSRPFDSEADTIVLVDNDAKKVTITGMGYAIGHYARWIKRGAVRVEATTSDPRVLVSAFIDENRHQVALVIINNSPNSKPISVDVKNVASVKKITGEQSTETTRWKALAPIAATANSFSLLLPANSVSSFAGSY